MADGRLFQALDQLAGVAGEEVEKARQFQLQQNQRIAALASMKEQQDREFSLEKGKLDALRAQVKLAQEKQKFEQSSELAGKNQKITELEAQTKNLQNKYDLFKAKQDLFGAAHESVIEALGTLDAAFKSGQPEEVLDDLSRYVHTIAKRNLGIDLFGQDINFQEAQKKQEGIDPLSKEGTDLTLKFQDRAERMSKDYQTVQYNLSTIEAAVNRLEQFPASEENRIAVQQAIITAFNKITDPSSVVRESEYARTPEGASALSRFKGFVERIQKGGKLTTKDNVEILNTARVIAKRQREIINEKLQKQIRQPAAKRGLNPEEIAPLFDPLNLPAPGTSKQGFREINQDSTAAPTFDITAHRKKFGL